MAVLIWSGVGFYVVLFNAAIQAIPGDLFEAAMLDGAGRLATFRRVTLPLLWDSVQVAFVLVQIMTSLALPPPVIMQKLLRTRNNFCMITGEWGGRGRTGEGGRGERTGYGFGEDGEA